MSYINRTTGQYPISERDIRALPQYATRSWPKPFAAPDEHAWVFPKPAPEYDPFAQGVREVDPVLTGLGTYEQAWEVYDLEPEQVEVNIVAVKERLIEAATAKRWAVETGGMVLPGGVQIATTTEDQNRITSVIANAERAGVLSVDFKASSGWISLSLDELKGIADAIALHVQACFTAERTHHETIALLTTAQDVKDYDVNENWPPNGN